ncbi:hypothetical protein Cni_G09186 [Canna indica]|uniref:U5 small nuclear ribonucleoprotein TSSC4 n=1 Tax=Canna indica TaxID=4628 RepID=A0AAQ3K442_9LILI|nr:hypothetical protein Cni_G09186 [Canna indica]
MDDSFDARVKRLFGSRLFETVPTSSFPMASWTVADGEVERQRWNRENPDGVDREDDPCASAFEEGGCFAKNTRSARRDRNRRRFEDDPDDDEEDQEGEDGPDGEYDHDGGREEREIRHSVGLDPALDYEEEEDEYDRTALNRDNTGDRVYMRDVKDHGPHLNFHTVVPDFVDDSSEEVHDFSRDPRADHFAACERLKEDKTTVESGHSSLPRINEEKTEDLHTKIAEDTIDVKPILKRKESQIDSKPKKRVRFDPSLKTTEEQHDSYMVPQAVVTEVDREANSQMPEGLPNIPDYLRNPTKYTCYTLDWSGDGGDDETNKKAFEDFNNLVKRSNPDMHEIPVELPKSITFTPQKKSHDAMSIDSGSGVTHEDSMKELEALACTTGIAAGDSPENDAHEMEEDETSVAEVSNHARKTGRRYRSKSSSHDSS